METAPRTLSRAAVVSVILPVILAVGLLAASDHRVADAQAVAATAPASETGLRITYPADGTLFPPDSVAPTVVWTDETAHVDRWTVVVRDHTGADVVTASVDGQRWRPSEDDWKRIKQSDVEHDAEVVVAGVDHSNPATT